MERLVLEPRLDWREKAEASGFIWHTANMQSYWDESAAYKFSLDQIDEIQAASNDLYQLFIQAGQKVLDDDLFEEFRIPEWAAKLVRETWNSEAPSLNYGRFDLGYDGKSPPKLFEFNADTPTSLFEAAIIQWQWKEDVFPNLDQFNNIHEALVGAYRELKDARALAPVVHFASISEDTGEDILTITYHRDCAAEAGHETEQLFMHEIGWNEGRKCFVDNNEREIGSLIKLYPWEWLINEEFAKHIPKADGMQWIEPIYKMLWSNKRVLALLTEMFPGHPNLLPTYLNSNGMQNYVRKPFLAREGSNITIVRNGKVHDKTTGSYDERDCVYQELYELPLFDGGYPVLGSWIIGGEAVGFGIREAGFITNNVARFIPHVIE